MLKYALSLMNVQLIYLTERITPNSHKNEDTT